jgi:hypothetical protein
MLLALMDQAFLLLFSFLYVMRHDDWSVKNGFPPHICSWLRWVPILRFVMGKPYGPMHITYGRFPTVLRFSVVNFQLTCFLIYRFSYGIYFKKFLMAVWVPFSFSLFSPSLVSTAS